MFWTLPTKFFLLLTGFLAALLLAGWIAFLQVSRGETKVVFLSVGEGDAILITQGQNQILIDSGRDGKRLLDHLGRFMPFYDHTLEVVIETHPDADHIGGFADLLNHYHVGHFLSTGAMSDTETVRLLQETLQSRKVEKDLAFAGTNIDFGDGGKLEVLYPPTPLIPQAGETNPGSIVSRYTFGKTSFLFTGDLPTEEAYLPSLSPITVLKVAHHGSRYSTSDAWLQEVKPMDAVISVGPNTYGHPAPEVLERLKKQGVNIFRTDQAGDVVYRCRTEWQECRQ